MMIIGCDFHPSCQQVSWVDTETGETGEQKLVHAEGQAKQFYQQLRDPLHAQHGSGNHVLDLDDARFTGNTHLDQCPLFWPRRVTLLGEYTFNGTIYPRSASVCRSSNNEVAPEEGACDAERDEQHDRIYPRSFAEQYVFH